LFTELYLSDTDNIVPFEITTPINQDKKRHKKRAQSMVDHINRSGIFKQYSVVR